MKRLLAIPRDFPRLTLATILAITLGFGFFARTITVDSSIETLLPTDDPDRVYYHEIREIFGSEEVAVIGVFADDVFTPAALAKIAALSERLAALDGVREVLSLSTVKTVEAGDLGLATGRLMREVPRTAEEAAALRARALATPLYVRNLVSEDGRAAGITVVLEPMSGEELLERGLEDEIRRLMAEAEGPERLALTGIPTLKAQGARMMERDIALFTPLAVALVTVILALAFRTVRGVLIPLATVGVGLVWTTGLMQLAGHPINMGTLVLPPLLITIGIAYSIHVVTTYYQEVRPDRAPAEVVGATLDHVALPVAICGLTTMIGFAPFSFSSIPAIADFGRFTLFGVGVVFVAALAIPSAALALLPVAGPRGAGRRGATAGALGGAAPAGAGPGGGAGPATGNAAGAGTAPARAIAPGDDAPPAEDRLGRALDRASGLAVLHPRAILFLAVVVCALAAWGVTRLRVDTDYLSFFGPRSPVRTDNALIAERLAGTQPVYVVVEGAGRGAATRLETLAAMRALQDFVDRQPGVDKTISILDYLALVRRALEPGVANGLPETQDEVDQILMLVDPKETRAVLARDGARANILVRTRLSGSGEVGAFVRAVEAFAAEHMPRGVTARATGTLVLLNRSADVLAWGQITGLWQVIVVLLAVMSFLFLSVRMGLLSLIPNVMPIVVLFGVMGWSGISLNISTSMIAAIAIGLAIDDTIHLLSSFNGELRRTGSEQQAIAGAMRLVGRAVTFTSVALVAGFLIVCLSSFQPVRHFGSLAAVTMAVALVVELLLTPALLASTRIITVWDLALLKLGRAPHEGIPLFAGLRPFQAKIVVLMAELGRAARGEYIARHGEMRAELYVLLGGRAEVRRGERGPVLRELARGDVVGEMGLIRHRPRSADVLVTEDAEYLVLHEDFLRRLQRRYPRIGAAVLLNLSRILSDRLESTTDQLAAAAEVRRAAAGA